MMLGFCVASANPAGAAERNPTCIVYPFETGAGVPPSSARHITERYAALLGSLGRFRIVSGAALEAQLATGALRRDNMPSLEVAAIKAARLVDAQYAVYGTVTRKAERYTLETGIAGIRAVKILRIVRSHYDGSYGGFARLAPPKNLKTLLGLTELPALPGQPTFPKPPEPTPPRPRPVTPPRPRPPTAAGVPRPAADWDALSRRVHEGLGGRIEIGTRITFFSLIEDHKDSFLGTIDKLDAEQSFSPFKVFAAWRFHPRYGVELTWDSMEVSTVTKWDGHSDGTIEAQGPILSLFGRYPTRTKWTPYASLGLGRFSTRFKPATWWALGYPSNEDYVGAGSPSFSYFGYRRHIGVDSTTALIILAGCDVAIREHLSADLFLRYMAVDIDAHYFITKKGEMFDDRGMTDIPLDNIALGLGVRYAF